MSGHTLAIPGLLDALTRASAGHGNVAIIEGGDVDDTVTAVLAAAEHRYGMRVAAGRCHPTDAPYAGVLRALSAMRPPAPAIQERVRAQVAGADPRDGQSRLPSRALAHFAGVNAILAALDDLTAQMPTVLVLQDLHQADAATHGTATRLATYAARIPALVVVTWHPDHHNPHTRALERVAAARRAPLVRLDPVTT